LVQKISLGAASRPKNVACGPRTPEICWPIDVRTNTKVAGRLVVALINQEGIIIMKTKTKLTAFLLPLAVAGFVAATTKDGHAVTFDDPLHGVCAGWIDNGTNTPLVSQPFSFSISGPDHTGTLLIEVLEPTASQVPGVNPIITGTSTTTGSIN